MKKLFLISVFFSLLFLFYFNALAEVPQMINYQGKLTKATGAPLDTTIQMVFSIYADPITQTYLWREIQGTVGVEKGVFNVLLGSVNSIPDSVFNGSIRYLGVRVGGDPEISPRQAIVSGGNAFRSENADVWDGHNWGDTYPYSSNSDMWDGYNWGDTYPFSSNSDMVDGIHGTQFLRNDQSGTINGSLTITGQNPLILAGAVETIRYDAAAISPYHGMLFSAHPTRLFIFGTINDAGQYLGTRMTIPAKGDISVGGPINLLSDGVEAGEIAMKVAGVEVLSYDGNHFRWGKNGIANYFQDDIGIGTSRPGFKLDVAGAAHASSFPTSSDARLKKNVTQLTNVLEKLEKIRGVSFDWNELYGSMGRSTDHREIGVIAQEVEAVFPELVTTWGEEKYRAVDYGRLTGVLIEAIKELKSENQSLRQRIETLDGKVSR